MSNQYLCDIMSLTLCYNNNWNVGGNNSIKEDNYAIISGIKYSIT